MRHDSESGDTGRGAEEKVYKITDKTAYFTQTTAKAGEIVTSEETPESVTLYVLFADGTKLFCEEKRKSFISRYVFVMPAQDVTITLN